MGLRASEFSYKSLWRRKLLQSLRLQAEVVYDLYLSCRTARQEC